MSEKREPFNPLLKSYPDSEKINACSLGAETLFTRLIAQCDDYAHYYADPATVCAKLYTQRMINGDVTAAVIAEWIGELDTQNLIVRYEVKGKRYLEIVNCRKALRSDVKRDERFPLPPGAEHNQRDSSELKDAARARNEPVTDAGRPRYVFETQPERVRDEPVTLTQPNLIQLNPVPAGAGGAEGSNGSDATNSVPTGPRYPAGLTAFWDAYPGPGRVRSSRARCSQQWDKQKLEPIAVKVLANLELWKQCEQWQKDGGRFVLAADRFLKDQKYTETPTVGSSGRAPVLSAPVLNR